MPVFPTWPDEGDSWQTAAGGGSLPFTGYMNRFGDSDWFKLNLSAGTYEISLLPDLAQITYPASIAPLIGLPADTPILYQESSIAANIWETYTYNGAVLAKQIGALTAKTDDLAMQGRTVPPGTTISFYDATVTLKGARTETFGQEQYNYTGEYFIEVSGQPVGLLLGTSADPQAPDHFTPYAGRYLITTGNPTGQRSATWGGDWIDTYDYLATNLPNPPITPPGIDVDPSTLPPGAEFIINTNTAGQGHVEAKSPDYVYDETTQTWSVPRVGDLTAAWGKGREAIATGLDDEFGRVAWTALKAIARERFPALVQVVEDAHDQFQQAKELFVTIGTFHRKALGLVSRGMDAVSGTNPEPFDGNDYDREANGIIHDFKDKLGQLLPQNELTETFWTSHQITAHHSSISFDVNYDPVNPVAAATGIIGHNNAFLGRQDADEFVGGNLNDFAYGADGNDVFYGGWGSDLLIGGPGADIIFGDLAKEVMRPVGVKGWDDQLWGNDGNDALIGGPGNDTLDGGAGGDLVSYLTATAPVFVNLAKGEAKSGPAGNDQLISIENVIGTDFDDFLTGTNAGRLPSGLRGGKGDDTLASPDLDTSVIADYADQAEPMTVDLGSGTVISPTLGTDTLVNIFGVLMNGPFDDRITGTSQDEWINPGGGNDTVDAGGGIDTLFFFGLTGSGLNGALQVNLAQGTATGPELGTDIVLNFENVITRGGDDAIAGTDGNNVINPGAGDDIVNGGAGSDTLDYSLGYATGATTSGGNPIGPVTVDLAAGKATEYAGGSDTLIGIENAVGNIGDDTLSGDAGPNVLLGAGGHDRLAGRGGNDFLAGGGYSWAGSALPGSGNDTLDGGDGDDSLWGQDGHDVVAGGAGIDGIVGGEGDDVLTGGGDTDYLFGGSFADDGSKRDGSGIDSIDGGNGHDSAWGFDGADTLTGGDGNDGLLGGGGADSLVGGDGNDLLWGGDFTQAGVEEAGSGADTLDGGAGIDGIWGFDGDDRIGAGAGDDWVSAGAGADLVLGQGDNDVLNGDAGNDTIAGDAGFDYLYGGAGGDTFVFAKGDSADSIWDFSAAEGDRLRLDPSFGIVNFAQFQALSTFNPTLGGAALSGFTFEGADFTVLRLSGGLDQLTIKGIAASAWTSDFLILG